MGGLGRWQSLFACCLSECWRAASHQAEVAKNRTVSNRQNKQPATWKPRVPLGRERTSPLRFWQVPSSRTAILSYFTTPSRGCSSQNREAYTPPITPEVTRAHVGDLPGTWKALLPTKSVPQALIDAQATMAQSQPSQLPPTGSANSSRATGTTGVLGKKTGPVANALYGCNNGCCDPDWLVNDMCWTGDWSWFYFNSPWSWTDSGDDTWTTRSLVCAAIGWSHLKIQVGGDNWAWWVPEGNYQSHAWYAGITWYGAWDSQHATSRVNMDSTDAKNTNTHCGQFNY